MSEIDNTHPTMDAAEAAWLTTEAKRATAVMWVVVARMRDEAGWSTFVRADGSTYPSFNAWAQGELDLSSSHAARMVDQGRVAMVLGSSHARDAAGIVPNPRGLSGRATLELAPLIDRPDDLAHVVDEATEAGDVTADAIRERVEAIVPPKPKPDRKKSQAEDKPVDDPSVSQEGVTADDDTESTTANEAPVSGSDARDEGGETGSAAGQPAYNKTADPDVSSEAAPVEAHRSGDEWAFIAADAVLEALAAPDLTETGKSKLQSAAAIIRRELPTSLADRDEAPPATTMKAKKATAKEKQPKATAPTTCPPHRWVKREGDSGNTIYLCADCDQRSPTRPLVGSIAKG